MASFNIYGCCICRDLFGFVPYNTHEVVHFLQSSSQISNFLFPTKPKKELTFEDFENIELPNFQKKCIIHDYNKTLLNYYTEKTDFIIVDLTNIANTNLVKEISEDGYEHYFTHSAWFNNAYRKGLDSFFTNSRFEIINRVDLLNKYGSDIILDRLIKWLKEKLHYKEEQIILIENNRTPYYTHEGKMYYFPSGTREEVNGILAELYKSFKEKCVNCHVIKLPIVAYADTDHPWSLTDQHFCHEFYEYLYQCVDAVAEDPIFCDEKIAQIREDFSLILYKKLNTFFKNSIVGKQFLKGNLSTYDNKYIASQFSQLYNNPIEKKPLGVLKGYSRVLDFDFPYSRVSEGYVNSDACIKGIIGADKHLDSYWYTVNNSTCVIFKDHSIIVKHAGNQSKGQMNIIQTVEDVDELYGNTVTLSVWARVLQFSNDNGRGGTLALIHSDSYNKGTFFKSKPIKNTNWQRISITCKLPEKENFKGLTVCLRANAGTGEKPINAIVEFSRPKLEIGSVPTKCEE